MKTEQFKERYLAGCSLWGTEYFFYLVTEGMDTVVATANGVTAKPPMIPMATTTSRKDGLSLHARPRTPLNNHNSVVYA